MDSQSTGVLDRIADGAASVQRQRAAWHSKPVLRRIYARWFAALRAHCLPGRTLEVGGGSGRLKESWPEVISSDVCHAPWLDLQADCARLPFRDASFANVVGVDVLHHIFDPDVALREMARTLRRDGRIVLVEPYVSPFAGVVRRLFHHERQDLTRDVIYGADKRPEDSNLAIPTRLFVRHRRDFERRCSTLRLLRVELSDILAYPLTGGFSRPSLLPDAWLAWVDEFERHLQFARRWLAFKMLVVLERVDPR